MGTPYELSCVWGGDHGIRAPRLARSDGARGAYLSVLVGLRLGRAGRAPGAPQGRAQALSPGRPVQSRNCRALNLLVLLRFTSR